MGKQIDDKLNEATFRNENELHDKKIIRVYVENDEDVPFWKFFFDKRNLKTKITPAQKGIIERGKQSVLHFADRAGKYFVLCVDSDFDYLLQNSTKQSELVNCNPYIFHTYIHSIESYKCYAETLQSVIIEATLIDNDIFDCVSFLEEYSKTIFDLFVYFFYFEKKHCIEFEKFTTIKFSNAISHPIHQFPLKESFNKNIALSKIDISGHGKEQLNELQKKINETLSDLPKIAEQELLQIKNELSELGVNEYNTYLFIQGHALHDNVVLKFLNSIFDNLKNEQLDVYKSAKQTTIDNGKLENMDKERENYKKIAFTSKKDEMTTIERVLFNHKFFEKCPFSSNILNDIDKYINSNFTKN